MNQNPIIPPTNTTPFIQSSRDWINLMQYMQGAHTAFPDLVTLPEPESLASGAPQINRYAEAAARINSEGLVIMRGLILKAGGTAWATGDNVMIMPRHLRPKHPQEIRWNGLTCVLKYDPLNYMMKIDFLYISSSWINLNNVIYYVD